MRQTEASPTDQIFLQKATELGRRGWGQVHPNPTVGCVLVRDGEIVGEGWHEELGGPHAEIRALERAGEKATGATAYVSLEPCRHFGRTPPCTTALLDAGIARVVFGASDPGRESGGGADILRAGGVEVVGPVLGLDEARRENPAFFFNAEHDATFVALKLAQTLDGRIASAPGRRTAITGPEARVETHRLRGGFDGVMVGSGTVLADDPLLTVREDVPFRKQPTRVILDSRCRLTPNSNLFRDLPEAPLLIFTGHNAPFDKIRSLEAAGAAVHRVDHAPSGLSLEAVLDVLWEEGLSSVFCEGGARLASRLMEGGLAGRLYLFVAPFVLGGDAVPAFEGLYDRDLWKAWNPAAAPRAFGRDVLLTFDKAR